MQSHTLLSDGSLTIEGPDGLLAPWLPHHATPAPRARSHLVLEPAPLGVVALSMPPTLSLLDVGAWVDRDGVLLRSSDGRQDGILELAGPGGTLGVVAGAHIEPLLTIATALILGRLGRALLHAAALRAPDGRVWLLVGDTYAGKSTTTATLVRAGWGWLADDQVVLTDLDGTVYAEGWARTPNLDAGYHAGRRTGERQATPLARRAEAGLHPLGGVLLPEVRPDSPTALSEASASDAFAALVRQSPWLLADPAATGPVQQLLMRTATLRSARLSLGRDSYGEAAPLLTALRSLVQ